MRLLPVQLRGRLSGISSRLGTRVGRVRGRGHREGCGGAFRLEVDFAVGNVGLAAEVGAVRLVAVGPRIPSEQKSKKSYICEQRNSPEWTTS